MCSFGLRDRDDFRACRAEEAATRRAREERADARACERRRATDARDEEKLLPQHATEVGRDLMRNATLSECAGDPLDPFGRGPAELAEDHRALAARAKNHAGTGELERDIDSAGKHGLSAGDRGDRFDVVEPVRNVITVVSWVISGVSA